MTRDPVCGMQFEESEAAASIQYKGITYYFCSASCKAAFEKEPEKYAHKSAGESGHHHHH